MGPDDSWRTQGFRQNVVAKIEEAIIHSGVKMSKTSNDMENHVYSKAKTREDYMNMVAKLILHVREMGQPKPNPGSQNMAQNQQGQMGQVQQQPGQGPSQGPPGNQGGMAPDPINALQNMASQGTRTQMMGMGPQGQMQQQGVMGPNPTMGMQGQMGQQGQMPNQGPQQQTATNLLQTLNQRPQMNMQMQNKLGVPMGMVPNQGQMGGQMMGGMGNPMNSQLQNQLAGPSMQGQMMSMPNSMQVPMSASNTMVGQMQCNQMGGGMGGQMAPNSMQGQMPGQMVGGMGVGGNQMVTMNMLHMQGRVGGKEVGMLGGGYGARPPPPAQFLRQSPSPSAPSPQMPGPSPNMVMGGAMPSPMSLGGLAGCAGVPSPSSAHQHHPQQQQQRVGMGMVASPSSSLNTPVGASVASPGGEDVAYREKVRQLAKYIEPLRRMVTRMAGEGENVEKLTKMKSLLDILSNPNKRMPLETLIKCELVLEKLDFKRGEGPATSGLHLPTGKEQIFNPLLEVVNNCLQSPFANHTLKRTFGPALEALNGPEIKNLPPPQKMQKIEEPPLEIPDVLQGEIARLDSRFKVSLDTMQLPGDEGGISLFAQLDSTKLPCVPPLQVLVPRDYPASPPSACLSKKVEPDSCRANIQRAMEARCKRLGAMCSVGQLLDAWEMSVRQACAPTAAAGLTDVTYTPVPALGL